jgi:hypothetical protein
VPKHSWPPAFRSSAQYPSGAIITGLGGVLANFIAVIYLRMYSATVTSVGGFHQRLVTTHHLHFGNFLTAKIEATGLRDKALAEMATRLAAPIPADAGVAPDGPPPSTDGVAASKEGDKGK